MEMNVQTIYQPHPLTAQGRQNLGVLWEEGRTLREHLIATGIDLHREVVIFHNSRLLTVSEWDIVCPVPGDLINVEATVSGGDDGSNPLAMVLSIAVMIFAPYATTALLGINGAAAIGSIGVSAVTAAISIAGSMVISALFRPSQASSAKSADTTSPTYSLSGGSNRMRPYEPLPVVMGNHRIFPDYGSKPYTEFEGDDQYLYQVFNFGIGDVILSDPRIGETLLSTYAGVTVTRAEGGVLPGFWGNVDTTEGASLTNAAGWVTRTTGTGTQRIAIDLVGTFYTATDSGGLSERSADFQIEYRAAGANTWQPYIPDDYTEVTHYWAKGYWSTSVVEEHYDGLTLVPRTETTVWVQRGYSNNLSPAAYTEGAAAASNEGVNTSTDVNWVWLKVAGGGPSIGPTIWRWVPVGAYKHPESYYNTSINQITLRGASSKPLRKTVSRTVPAGKYDVRARRVSADETKTKHQSTVEWTVMRSYQEGVADYSHQTVYGVKIKANGQLNGALQQLSAHAVRQTPVWNGSAWELQATTNPAWWYLHMAMGYRDDAGRLLYGGGLSLSQIDVEGIKAWATFCDTHYLSFSAVFDQVTTLSDALQTIARCGFGSPSWASGKLGVVWDAPNQTPVMAFGMSNICKGSFEISYITDNLADEIVVNYNDRNKYWESNQVRVTVPGTVGTPIKTSSVDLMGCTTNAMAAKFANALAAQQYYRRRNITWETDMEGFVCQRGDVVILSHDLTQWGYSGRLVAVDGIDVLTLDRSVPRSGSTDYLMLQWPDGETQIYVIDPASGDTDTLTLPSGIALQDGYGPVDHKWYFSPLPTPGKKVKITSVQPLSETRIRLTATDEGPEYYAAWNGTFTEPGQQTLLTGPVKVDGLTLTILPLVLNMRPINRVTAAWTPHGPVESHTVRAYLDDALLQTWTGLKEPMLDIDIDRNALSLRVEVTPIGAQGPGVMVSETTALEGLVAPPAPISVQLFASPDGVGHVSKARIKVAFDTEGTIPVAGLLLFFSAFNFENYAIVASGGTGTTLTLSSTGVIQSGTVTVLAGSTVSRIVTRTSGDPFDTTINHGGRFWARLPGGEWRKCTGLDALALLFDPPHEVTPIAGMVMEFVEISWADNRQGDSKMALIQDGANYEIVRWGQMDQDGAGGDMRLLDCERGAEGTTPISADGKALHYYPALGSGTTVSRFPAEVFTATGELQFVGEADVDFSVPSGYYAAGSAAVYSNTADGNFIRSPIVPVTYGGPL